MTWKELKNRIEKMPEDEQEKTEKLGQEPAFARPATLNPLNAGINSCPQSGMSKRFYAACAAMQGLLSNTNLTVVNEPEWIIEWAYSYADELLKREGEL